MSWLYLIPGLICLIIGAGFLLLFRYSNTKENELGHRVKAKAWAKLIDTECRIEDSYTPYISVFTNTTPMTGSTFLPHLPSGIPVRI